MIFKACRNGTCDHVEKHSCVDCREKFCSRAGKCCEQCGAFWCIDWNDVFTELRHCPHVPSEKIICPQCYFANPEFQCTDTECNACMEECLDNWTAHCGFLIVLGTILLLGPSSRQRIFVARPRKQDGKANTDIWPIDTDCAIYGNNSERKEFHGADSLQKAIKYAWRQIDHWMRQGHTVQNSDYVLPGVFDVYRHGRAAAASVSPTRERDHSPKRAATK